MTDVQPLIGRTAACERLRRACERTLKGSGDVILVNAEPGMGKSSLLTWVQDMCKASMPELTVLRVDCRPPIGAIHVGGIQPLQPFGHAIEQLYMNSGAAAKKRLALNIGMSLLASVPIAGDLFYAVKAISQDVSEYKRETSATQQKKRAAVTECLETLKGIAERQPYVLLVDDAQWSDSQSVEVLRTLVSEASTVPLLLVWCVSSSASQRINPALTALLRTPPVTERTITLPALTAEESAHLVRQVAGDREISSTMMGRFHERSAGIPAILVEYVKYMERTGDFSDEMAVPISDHPNSDVTVSDVSDDDATVLSLCAAEGREFTAFMLSALMNTDVLTVIQRCRRLQRETGLITSIGMRTRYGVKTTVYEFTSAFAYTYFLHRPEYEERKAVHQRIADVLQREFTSTPHEEMRMQLAGFIAAHSAEAEDLGTTERMLALSAAHAASVGADEIRGHIVRDLMPLYGALADEDSGALIADGVQGGTAESTDAAIATARAWSDKIRILSDLLVAGKTTDVLRHCATALADPSMSATRSEHCTLLLLAARAAAEEAAWSDADHFAERAERAADGNDRDVCHVLNVRATILYRRGDLDGARDLLFAAARYAESLPSPSKLLTLSNIVLLLRDMNDPSADRYERVVRTLASELSWNELRADLRL